MIKGEVGEDQETSLISINPCCLLTGGDRQAGPGPVECLWLTEKVGGYRAPGINHADSPELTNDRRAA